MNLGLGLRLGGSGSTGVPGYTFAAGATPASATFTRASAGYAFNASGILASNATDVLRDDYNSAALVWRGKLIEPARTNLVQYSEQFNNAAWAKNACTASADATTAPDGTSTADKFIPNAGSVSPYINRSSPITVSNGAAYTSSFFVKRGDYRYAVIFELASGTGAGLVVFDLQSGTVSGAANGATVANGAIVPLADGWYRISYSYTSTGTSNQPRIYLSGSGTAITNVTGDGVLGAFVWGGQFEAGASASAYIQTVAATATRAVDALVLSGTAIGLGDGSYTMRYTFDNATTQDVATTIASGTWTVPTNLNRAWIKSVVKV